MRIILSSAAIVASLAAIPAFAADLPMKAPAMIPAAAPFSWTGCHIGGHIGGVFGEGTSTDALGNSASRNSSGFVGGGQIGCDYQFAPGWVIGAEGRAAWSSLKASSASTVIFPAGRMVPSQFSVSNDFLASATARLGYSFANPWLVYVKGGAAWANEKVDDAFIAPIRGIAVDPSTSNTRTGWTIGTGAEWAFAPNWSATLEYDYYDFGSKGLTLTAPSEIVTVASFKATIHEVTVGVNYHF
jgi:outer membrane immunogenic protein